MTAQLVTIKGIITGKVQGVWYRRFVEHEASLYHIQGYAKNLSDGSVEVLLTGGVDPLFQFLQQMFTGPQASRVDNIAIYRQPTTALQGFKIL
ncbi:Acylphosphatase [Sinobacterium norvegicum]|uniref:acylphosphatase n=1 Tax=Sinobacterium norvegicum TaxID=1641715 RepID=A0ABM9AEA2_9GAMM|nr:acylphosphatase [Sinobacterium norvegicum]CAH0991411.1 Acylphosphatase [Sinobacterium norvegicum]